MYKQKQPVWFFSRVNLLTDVRRWNQWCHKGISSIWPIRTRTGSLKGRYQCLTQQHLITLWACHIVTIYLTVQNPLPIPNRCYFIKLTFIMYLLVTMSALHFLERFGDIIIFIIMVFWSIVARWVIDNSFVDF